MKTIFFAFCFLLLISCTSSIEYKEIIEKNSLITNLDSKEITISGKHSKDSIFRKITAIFLSARRIRNLHNRSIKKYYGGNRSISADSDVENIYIYFRNKKTHGETITFTNTNSSHSRWAAGVYLGKTNASTSTRTGTYEGISWETMMIAKISVTIKYKNNKTYITVRPPKKIEYTMPPETGRSIYSNSPYGDVLDVKKFISEGFKALNGGGLIL